MSLSGIRTRNQVIQSIRQTLTSYGFEEFELQLARQAIPTEPTIYPCSFTWHQTVPSTLDTRLYLPTSPEAALKLAMAAGAQSCFSIQNTFRNMEGTGRIHRPEFIMAEYYQPHLTYQDMMTITQNLILKVVSYFSSSPSIPIDPWPRFSWIDLWEQHLHADLSQLISLDSMIHFAQTKGYTTDEATWEQLFYQITDNEIIPSLPESPFFLVDFPSKISPFALSNPSNPNFAQRFELMINGIELANGNTERFDAKAVQTIMETEIDTRGVNLPLDTEFIRAIKKLEGQPWAGVGLGIDRLAMIVGEYKNISDVQDINV